MTCDLDNFGSCIIVDRLFKKHVILGKSQESSTISELVLGEFWLVLLLATDAL